MKRRKYTSKLPTIKPNNKKVYNLFENELCTINITAQFISDYSPTFQHSINKSQYKFRNVK